MKTILLITTMLVLGACASQTKLGSNNQNTQAQNQNERNFEPRGQRL